MGEVWNGRRAISPESALPVPGASAWAWAVLAAAACLGLVALIRPVRRDHASPRSGKSRPQRRSRSAPRKSHASGCQRRDSSGFDAPAGRHDSRASASLIVPPRCSSPRFGRRVYRHPAGHGCGSARRRARHALRLQSLQPVAAVVSTGGEWLKRTLVLEVRDPLQKPTTLGRFAPSRRRVRRG